MIKGHAVIELKDEVTGEIQRIEHDNMITNGLKYCMTPWLGKFSYANLGSSMQYLTDENTDNRKNSNKSMLNHLMGGIFLFENELEENVDNVSFPSDNPLTGKASWDAYSGIDTSRGSYNDQESGLQDDGSYRHVWDFGTSQANGQISALALTTYIGGICGDGYTDWDFNTQPTIYAEPLISLGDIKINNINNPYFTQFCDPGDNAIYFMANRYNLYYVSGYTDQHFGSTGKLTLVKRKFPLTKMSPFYDYYNQYISEDVDIIVPPEFTEYAQMETFKTLNSDNYVYVFREYSYASGNQFKILRIKKSDLSADVLTITNNTDDTWYMYARNTVFTDKYMFVTSTTIAGLYRIDLTKNEAVLVQGGISDTGYKMIAINGYVYGTRNPKTYCINAETMEVKAHPYVSMSNELYGVEKLIQDVYIVHKKYSYGSTGYDYASVCLLSSTLMTINNLSSPVTKTASQSMKITYTLTETE